MIYFDGNRTSRLPYSTATARSIIINKTQPRTKFCRKKISASFEYFQIFWRSIKGQLNLTSSSCSFSQLYTDIKLNTEQFWRETKSIFASPWQHHSAFSAVPSNCLPYSEGKSPYLLPGTKTQSFVSILSNFNCSCRTEILIALSQ